MRILSKIRSWYRRVILEEISPSVTVRVVDTRDQTELVIGNLDCLVGVSEKDSSNKVVCLKSYREFKEQFGESGDSVFDSMLNSILKEE